MKSIGFGILDGWVNGNNRLEDLVIRHHSEGSALPSGNKPAYPGTVAVNPVAAGVDQPPGI